LNKYFPAKYLDYLSNIVGSSQNHMEIQMGLQLMSQLIFETDFMGCDTGGMLKRYAQAYIEK
jgi:hypothetical protein